MTTPATAAGIIQIKLDSIRPTTRSEVSIGMGRPASPCAYAELTNNESEITPIISTPYMLEA